jgi:hypothetical protein
LSEEEINFLHLRWRCKKPTPSRPSSLKGKTQNPKEILYENTLCQFVCLVIDYLFLVFVIKPTLLSKGWFDKKNLLIRSLNELTRVTDFYFLLSAGKKKKIKVDFFFLSEEEIKSGFLRWRNPDSLLYNSF